MSKEPKKIEVPEIFLDCIKNAINNEKDTIDLFIGPYQNRASNPLLDKLRARLRKIPEYSIYIAYVQIEDVPGKRPGKETFSYSYAYKYRYVCVFTHKMCVQTPIYFDLLTGIRLFPECGEPYAAGIFSRELYNLTTKQGRTYFSLDGPTLFDEYFFPNTESWKRVSEFLKVCGDVAEETGFNELSYTLNLFSDRKEMFKFFWKLHHCKKAQGELGD